MTTGIAGLNASNQKENRNNMENLTLTKEWDKTFPKSDKIDHSKVTFVNRYGITLAADMYKTQGCHRKTPGNSRMRTFRRCKGTGCRTLRAGNGGAWIPYHRLRPIVYRRKRRHTRYMTSPDINTEDFSAAVDYLVTNPEVDREKVGIIGICGWGGIAINAAASDPRIKATLASTMYDMSRVNANGYFDAEDSAEARNALREKLATQRTEFGTTSTALPNSVAVSLTYCPTTRQSSCATTMTTTRPNEAIIPVRSIPTEDEMPLPRYLGLTFR